MNRNKVAFLPTLICALILVILIIIHVIPVPILEPLILYVVLSRPRWFKKVVDSIYSREDIKQNNHAA
ncbi:hypothetical protein [Methylomicrobium lacus]|uniref:hypothetical protein n=1 Tax=Methylomicrobium lacus TaxID=136992 RepID=UPI0035A9990E